MLCYRSSQSIYNGCGGGGGLEVVVDGADDEVDEAFVYCST